MERVTQLLLVATFLLLPLASAATIELETTDTTRGEDTALTGTLALARGEGFMLTGGTIVLLHERGTTTCSFDATGAESCPGFEVELTTTSQREDGPLPAYGHDGTEHFNTIFTGEDLLAGDDALRVDITWDTSDAYFGNHEARLILNGGDEDFVNEDQAFLRITEDSSPETAFCARYMTDIPFSCAGDVTRDDMEGGCRIIACSADGNTQTLRLCRGVGFSGTGLIDIYRIGGNQEPVICVGDTCADDSSQYYAATYPACTLTDEIATIAPLAGYPLEHNIALRCQSGLEDATYTWRVDGVPQDENGEILTYTAESAGVLSVSCDATNGDATVHAERGFTVQTPLAFVDDPYAVRMFVTDVTEESLELTCDFVGWRPDAVRWDVNGDVIEADGITIDKDAGEVTCTGIVSPANAHAVSDEQYFGDVSLTDCEECLTRSLTRTFDATDEAQASLYDGALAYYPLDGNGLDLINGHTLEDLEGTFVEGIRDEGLSLGTDESVAGKIWDLRASFGTVGFWGKLEEPGVILELEPDLDLVWREDGHVALQVNKKWKQQKDIITPFAVSGDQWHHFLIRVQAGSTQLLMDGELVGTVDLATTTIEHDWMLGSGRAGYRGPSAAALTYDELGFWSRALHDEEALALYNGHRGLSLPFGTDMEVPSFCADEVRDLPVSCAGEITRDEIRSSGCRAISCESESGSVEVLACDKPGEHNAVAFEMYRLGSSGVQPDVCLDDQCLRDTGYLRAETLPYCVA